MSKSFKILAGALGVSTILNLVLVALLVFKSVEEPLALSVIQPTKKGVETKNAQALATMSKLTFRELVSFLTNKELFEEGLTKRDLTLGSLATFHHFDVARALAAQNLQVRNVDVVGVGAITLFPGLTDDQFEAIVRFAYQEKWPLTAKGLFLALQKPHDATLEQAFMRSPEFHFLQTLFLKTDAVKLLAMLREGSWGLLESFVAEESLGVGDPLDRRRDVLLRYVAAGSKTAASFILTTDYQYALKKLEDASVLEVLSAVAAPSDEAKRFCAELLRSPRSDAVHEKAAAVLYTLSGEKPAPVVDRYHVVKDGESLWKISRQYQVKVEEIVKINGLEGQTLKPGMTLKLPHGTGS